MPHAWAEVDLDAIRFNLMSVRSRLRPWVEVIAMVKGNAYGHGAVEVSRALLAAGASRLGVAFVSEAIELRRAGIAAPIVLLGSFTRSEADDIVANDLTTGVYDLGLARHLSDAAGRRGRRMPVHADVDTGMARLGVRHERASAFVEELALLPGLRLEGIYTHLSCADEPDQTYSRLQVRRFSSVLERLAERGVSIPVTHVQNSAGLIALPDLSFAAVRPGLVLYGLHPGNGEPARGSLLLRPALSLYSRIVHVKRVPADTFVSYNRTYRTAHETHLATVSVGYADGYPRLLSSRGRVLVGGRSVPVVGRVTMDHVIVDLGPDERFRIGDRVTLIGRDGGEEIGADEIADQAGTISYEITTGITHRVPRVFREGQAAAAFAPAAMGQAAASA
jgi:alanine racemase